MWANGVWGSLGALLGAHLGSISLRGVGLELLGGLLWVHLGSSDPPYHLDGVILVDLSIWRY